jgi:hypothetical protein
MGLFSKKDNTVPATQAPPTTYNNDPHGHHTTRHSTDSHRRNNGGGMFSRRRSSSLSSSDFEDNRKNSGGLLHRGNRNSQSMNHGHPPAARTSGGMFSRNRDMEDPSIAAARERVQIAEQSERDAERALMHSRNAVHDAKAHVRNLEVEAAEDARRAKAKQHAAKDIGKHSSKLGRKF